MWSAESGEQIAEIINSAICSPTSTFKWRKGWDSNPRNPFEVHSISNAANSTTLAPFQKCLAERVGFEPTVPVKVRQFSRLLDSTTLAPLRANLQF